MRPEMTIVTDFASAEQCCKGFRVSDAMANSDFGYADAKSMGVSCNTDAIKFIMDSDPQYKEAVEKFCKDAGLSLGEANIDALGQFFTYFNEATINVLYRGRTAAQTFGVKTMGDWTTERIVFKTRELTATHSVYDDWTRAPFAAYNYGWDVRDTIRLEWAKEVMKLEEAVASVMRRNADKDKMEAITLNNAIVTNEHFWYGTSVAGKKLYGALNDPGLAGRKTNLPGDVDFNNTLNNLTVDDVVNVLRTIKQEFTNDLQGAADIETLPVELACPLKWQTVFTIQNSVIGYTANKWMAENWKSATITFKPELDTADDGEPLMDVFAKSVPDVGLDTVNLIETSKLRLIGAVPTVKGREESYSSSVAGAFISAPFAVKLYANGGDSGQS